MPIFRENEFINVIISGLRNSGTIYHKKEDDNNDDNNEETDEYNKLMKELVFEPKKAKAQDRLKTDEEIVKETKERLELLEQLRVQRMKGGDIGMIDGCT